MRHRQKLPPGDYILRVVLSDGSKFGKTGMHLTVPPIDSTELEISSIVLCKQFHAYSVPFVAPGLNNSPSTLPQFVPLVSKDREFTPTGVRSFGKRTFSSHTMRSMSRCLRPSRRQRSRLA